MTTSHSEQRAPTIGALLATIELQIGTLSEKEQELFRHLFIVLFALTRYLDAESFEITREVVKASADACGVEAAKLLAQSLGVPQEIIDKGVAAAQEKAGVSL